MITVTNLSKKFGSKQALKPVTFSVPTGEVLGLLGANGAGKTTTMRLLATILEPTTGSIEIQGWNIQEHPDKIRGLVGYLPEKPPLYEDLTVGDYLQFVAEMRGVENPKQRLSTVLEQVGLLGWEQTLIKVLSKGYRQRVGLAQAIVHDPAVLLLDEPNSGLDPSQIVGMRQFLTDMATERTVVVSSHILGEMNQLCSRHIILNHGEIAAQGTMSELQESFGGRYLEIRLRNPNGTSWLKTCSELPFVQHLSVQPSDLDVDVESVQVNIDSIQQSLLIEWFLAQELEIVECQWTSKSLEQIFLEIVGAE